MILSSGIQGLMIDKGVRSYVHNSVRPGLNYNITFSSQKNTFANKIFFDWPHLYSQWVLLSCLAMLLDKCGLSKKRN